MKIKKLKNNFSLYVLVLLFVFVFSVTASAQIPFVGESVRIDISPENPRGGQVVTIEIESFSVDLDRSVVSWTVDGEVVRRSVGSKTFSLRVGGVGEASVVGIFVDTQEEGVFQRSVVLTPSEVDLVWETDSYTPPLYRGKALHSPGGDVRVVAVPNIVDESGERVSAGSLLYTWRKDGSVVGGASGHGKNVFEFTGSSFGRGSTISVVVEAPDSSVKASGGVVIDPVAPEVHVYKNSPLLGVLFGKAFQGEAFLDEEEIVLEAYPYYFSTDRRDDVRINYVWRVSGREVEEQNKKTSLTLRAGAGSGARSVSVSAQNTSKTLQFGKGDLLIRFGE